MVSKEPIDDFFFCSIFTNGASLARDEGSWLNEWVMQAKAVAMALATSLPRL